MIPATVAALSHLSIPHTKAHGSAPGATSESRSWVVAIGSQQPRLDTTLRHLHRSSRIPGPTFSTLSFPRILSISGSLSLYLSISISISLTHSHTTLSLSRRISSRAGSTSMQALAHPPIYFNTTTPIVPSIYLMSQRFYDPIQRTCTIAPVFSFLVSLFTTTV